MKKPANQSKRISVRLDNEASKKLEEAKKKGYTTSQFVNVKLKNANTVDLNSLRNVMISLNKIQTELEFEENIEIRTILREELNKICQFLKSFQNHM